MHACYRVLESNSWPSIWVKLNLMFAIISNIEMQLHRFHFIFLISAEISINNVSATVYAMYKQSVSLAFSLHTHTHKQQKFKYDYNRMALSP